MAGVVSSINDFFRGKPAQAASPAAVASGVQVDKPLSQHNPGASSTAMANQPNNTAANGDPNPVDPNAPISPLDQYKDIWQTPTTKDGQQPVDPFSQPLLSTDPTKLAEAARKMNFAQGIDQAQVQKALSGDPQALLAVINTVGQNSFLAASQLTTQVTEGAVSTNNKRVDSVLEDKFKRFMLEQQRSENPIFNHAAAQPMLDLAKRQLMSKHPDKSPAEIHKMAEGFLSDFASTITGGAAQEKQSAKGPDAMDFSGW